MPSIQINVRLKPYQVYEIKKISEHFDTTPSIVIRNAIDDYIDVFKIWHYRLDQKLLSPGEDCKLEYKVTKTPVKTVEVGLCSYPGGTR